MYYYLVNKDKVFIAKLSVKIVMRTFKMKPEN